LAGNNIDCEPDRFRSACKIHCHDRVGPQSFSLGRTFLGNHYGAALTEHVIGKPASKQRGHHRGLGAFKALQVEIRFWRDKKIPEPKSSWVGFRGKLKDPTIIVNYRVSLPSLDNKHQVIKSMQPFICCRLLDKKTPNIESFAISMLKNGKILHVSSMTQPGDCMPYYLLVSSKVHHFAIGEVISAGHRLLVNRLAALIPHNYIRLEDTDEFINNCNGDLTNIIHSCLESALAFAPRATRRRMGRSRGCSSHRASRAGVDLPCKSGEPSPMEDRGVVP